MSEALEACARAIAPIFYPEDEWEFLSSLAQARCHEAVSVCLIALPVTDAMVELMSREYCRETNPDVGAENAFTAAIRHLTQGRA